ncbi:YkgJ family cysteine cluster protein [Carboxylicivirga sp. N1Y90]|uniref:YkgJ family cysteine cluster protein n=1 Tax=Carboxylicivirga fragile TaxID=3417571 RepID=UPI003D333150|nr:YkgJ family cysteine cluster protein [Marinilabiliaceae bacterium N1Y90]
MSIKKYYQLRNEIDAQTKHFDLLHQENMVCKKGCDKCCLDFDVFPIEYEAVKVQIQKEYPDIIKTLNQSENKERCAFLINGQCTIYNARPIICRTHGYPLINMNEAGDQWELSFCELNFTKVDDTYFDEDNVYEQDTNNSKLFMMNYC